jgi:hypothetical protein
LCLTLVALFPLFFYFPKFFEYRYETLVREANTTLNCTVYATEVITNGIIMMRL